MIKTYCFKLYNSKKNKHLHKLIRLSAQIYNHCIALHRRYYRLYHKHLNKYKLQLHITKLKKRPKYIYWNNLNSQAIQDITDRIDKAYKLFFSNLKRKSKCAPPSFKKSIKYKSFTLKQTGYKFDTDNSVLIAGLKYKYFKSRDIIGDIKTVTIKRNALGDLYIYVTCELDCILALVRPRTGKSVGFDFGLKTYLVASDGNNIMSPLFFKEHQNTIRQLNKELSRKQKGSHNRHKAKLALARQHLRIVNQRKDFQFNLANKLCQDYDVICLEDLNIKAMQQLWGKKVSDLSHSSFVEILKQQASAKHIKVIQIPRFSPSSKTCSSCGYLLDDLPLRIRSWTCPNCNANHNRDLNAAINIFRVGASTLAGGAVSLDLSS